MSASRQTLRSKLGSISSSRCQKSRKPVSLVKTLNAKRCSRTYNRHIPMERTVNTTTKSRHLFQTSGGGRRDRTDDLMLAKHALSQLSYAPVPEDECSTLKHFRKMRCRDVSAAASIKRRAKMVGLGRLELPTSRLSSARSNQLSYKP